MKIEAIRILELLRMSNFIREMIRLSRAREDV